MRNFTLILAAAFTALAMTATPGKTDYRHLGNKQLSQAEVAQKALFKAPVQQLKAVTAASDEIISETPEGDLRYYNEWGNGYYIYWEQWFWSGKSNSAGQIVWAADNVVYIKHAISSYVEAGWVKGTLSDDGKKITVKYPQHIKDYISYDSEGTEYILPTYVSVMKRNPEVEKPSIEDSQSYIPVADEDNYVTYTVKEDGSVVMDGSHDFDYEINPETGELEPVFPDTMLSIYYVRPERPGLPEEKMWYYYADISQEFIPFDESQVIINDIPEGLSYEKWGMIYGDEGKAQFVDVAFDDNNVYLNNFDIYTQNCVIKGSLEGDKVVFPSNQFFGVNEEKGFFLYMCGCKYGTFIDEETGEEIEGYYLIDNFEMKYDAAEKKLTPAEAGTGIVFNTRLDRVSPFSLYSDPTIFYQAPEKLNAAPEDPEIQQATYNPSSLSYASQWAFPNININGMILDTDKMYYEVYTDGQLYTFSPEVYLSIAEEMTQVPYNYCDAAYEVIIGQVPTHIIFLQGMKMTTMGIRVYYDAPDGNTYNTMRVTYNFKTGKVDYDAIDTISADAELCGTEYFNLQGMKVAAPTPGNIYLRSEKYSDGTKKVQKFIAR